jgi:hypothetical protein
MDIFTQKRMLIRIAVLMTVLNLLLIGFLLFKDSLKKPPRPIENNDKRNVSEILKDELKLSEMQVGHLMELRQTYFEKENKLSSAIKNERDSINMFMFNKSENEELIRSLARRVAENEYNIEMLRFQQAQELKLICTQDQLEKFERLVREIRDYFRKENKPEPR